MHSHNDMYIHLWKAHTYAILRVQCILSGFIYIYIYLYSKHIISYDIHIFTCVYICLYLFTYAYICADAPLATFSTAAHLSCDRKPGLLSEGVSASPHEWLRWLWWMLWTRPQRNLHLEAGWVCQLGSAPSVEKNNGMVDHGGTWWTMEDEQHCCYDLVNVSEWCKGFPITAITWGLLRGYAHSN